jgi:hypothetical protein
MEQKNRGLGHTLSGGNTQRQLMLMEDFVRQLGLHSFICDILAEAWKRQDVTAVN